MDTPGERGLDDYLLARRNSHGEMPLWRLNYPIPDEAVKDDGHSNDRAGVDFARRLLPS
jgi:hypothetical protein